MNLLPVKYPALNTLDSLNQQTDELGKQVEKKKEQLEGLKRFQEVLSFESGKLDAMTRSAQEMLKQDLFHTCVPLSSHVAPLQHWENLIKIAKQVERTTLLPAIQDQIKKVNGEVGKTDAQAAVLEENTQKLDQTLQLMKQLLEERKTSLLLTQQQLEDLKKL